MCINVFFLKFKKKKKRESHANYKDSTKQYWCFRIFLTYGHILDKWCKATPQATFPEVLDNQQLDLPQLNEFDKKRATFSCQKACFLCGTVTDLLICCNGSFKYEINVANFDALTSGAVNGRQRCRQGGQCELCCSRHLWYERTVTHFDRKIKLTMDITNAIQLAHQRRKKHLCICFKSFEILQLLPFLKSC